MNHPTNNTSIICNGGSSEPNVNINKNKDGVNSNSNNGVVLKKGPWTATEDAILVDYVKKHGEGNWNAVQKNSGLSRCGKSCRLRWTNHLRPNLKKGSFSPEEERLILELHAKLGNKWSRMAAQLPGRTDNEIKNFWNTRMKKRLRAGLFPYPQDSQKQTGVRRFRQNYLSQTLSQTSQVPQPSTQFPSNYRSLYKFDQINATQVTPLGSHLQFQHHGVGLSLPFSLSSSLVSPLFNDSFRTQFPLGSTPRCGFTSYDLNPSSILRTPFEPDGIIPHSSTLPMKMELPSSQLPQPAANAPALGTFFDYNFKFPFSQNSSGLLDDLLEEANIMSGKKPLTVEEKGSLDGLVSNNPPSGCVFNERDTSQPTESKSHMVDFNPTNGCTDVKMKKEPDSHEFDCADDDLSDLLNIIPPAKTNPEMGHSNSGEMSNGQASSVTDDDISLELQQLVSSLPPMGSAADHDWAFGTWNNMPGIC